MTGPECRSDAYSCLNNAYACETSTNAFEGVCASPSPFHHFSFNIFHHQEYKTKNEKAFPQRVILKWDHRFSSICVVYQSFIHFTFRMTSRQVFDLLCNTCTSVEIHIKHSFICSTLNKQPKSTQMLPYRHLYSVLTRDTIRKWKKLQK